MRGVHGSWPLHCIRDWRLRHKSRRVACGARIQPTDHPLASDCRANNRPPRVGQTAQGRDVMRMGAAKSRWPSSKGQDFVSSPQSAISFSLTSSCVCSFALADPNSSFIAHTVGCCRVCACVRACLTYANVDCLNVVRCSLGGCVYAGRTPARSNQRDPWSVV